MQIFIDSADPAEIRKYYDLGIIDGVTTNPSLASKVGRPYREMVDEILSFVNGPVSLEVLGTTYDEMLREARGLSQLNPNVYVKIPILPEGIKAVKALAAEGIKTNVTLVFSPTQALFAAKAGANFVSPFIGRFDDAGQDGMIVLKEIVEIYKNYQFPTKVLAASIRSPRHLAEAALIGADIATVSPEALEKSFTHPLTDKGLQKFLDDFKKSGLQPLV